MFMYVVFVDFVYVLSFVSLLSSSFVQMIVVASALRKEQMKSEEIISLENELGRDWKRRKEFFKIRKNMERGGV